MMQGLPIECHVIARFRELARSWGGDVWKLPPGGVRALRDRATSKSSDSYLWEAPFTSRQMGVMWRRGVLVYEPLGDGEDWVDMPHELGHLFASRVCPDNAGEFAFFGWEHELVRHVGADFDAWVRSNASYAVEDDGAELGDMSPETVSKMFVERVKVARDAGLFTPCGLPASVRGFAV